MDTIRRAALHCIVAGAALAVLVGYAGTARADDMDICHDKSGDVAIAACTRAIKSGGLNKHNLAVAYTSRGVEWRAKGDVERAIQDHSEAIRIYPSLPEAWYNRANAHRQKRELDGSIKDYTEAIRLNPREPDFYNNRGNSYKDTGDFDRAITDYTEAIRLNPRKAIFYKNRGEAFEAKGDATTAKADFATADSLAKQ